MSPFLPMTGYVICSYEKPEVKEKKIITIDADTGTKIYKVIAINFQCDLRLEVGDRIILSGYAQPIIHNDETYYCVKEEHIGCKINE